MDFNGDLLTCCGKTYLRAFLLHVYRYPASLMPKMLSAKRGIQYLRRGGEQIVLANPVWLFIQTL